MRYTVALIGCMIVVPSSGCGETMNEYSQSQIEILSVNEVSPASTEVTYQPMLESMYYCPGAKVRQEGGRTKISFVRCKIKASCSVDVNAEKLDDGEWKVIIPAEPKRIDVVFRDAERRLSVETGRGPNPTDP